MRILEPTRPVEPKTAADIVAMVLLRFKGAVWCCVRLVFAQCYTERGR